MDSNVAWTHPNCRCESPAVPTPCPFPLVEVHVSEGARRDYFANVFQPLLESEVDQFSVADKHAYWHLECLYYGRYLRLFDSPQQQPQQHEHHHRHDHHQQQQQQGRWAGVSASAMVDAQPLQSDAWRRVLRALRSRVRRITN